ncbi:hypothetical protein HDK77DRAFT_85761 [Phyllosticta capitalensis]
MSSLGYMMPTQYGSFTPSGTNFDPYGYPQDQSQHSTSQQPTYPQSSGAPSPYMQSYPPTQVLRSSPGADFGVSRHSSLASAASAGYMPGTNDPSALSGATGQTSQYPPIHPNLPAPGGMPYGTNYTTSQPYNAASYGSMAYPPAQSAQQMYPAPPHYSQPYPGGPGQDPSSAAAAAAALGGAPDRGVRVLNSRPKPQCWEHGCNGRQFSTFSNLLRHQREKSGTAAKSYCPRCGAEFTRTTARNGHMAHEKCKPRKASDAS